MGRKRHGKPAADQRAGDATVSEGGTADGLEPVVLAEEPAAALHDDAATALADGPAGRPVAGEEEGAETPAVDLGEEAEKEGMSDEAATVSGEQDSTASGQRDPDRVASMGAFERATFAAAMARHEVEDVLEIDVKTGRYGKSLSLEAARFILAERGAPAESIPIHLALKGLGGSRKPDALTVLGWAVFKDVFTRVFDHLDAIEKAAAAAAAKAPPAPAWPGERALQAEPGPLDATGGMLRR
jgi:hypothetical protein